MADSKYSLDEFLSQAHPLYDRYFEDWTLAYNSYIGGVEYRHGRYLRAYETDTETTSETINTYDVDGDGGISNKYRSRLNKSNSYNSADRGLSDYEGTFYYEKLSNTPLFPYVRLYCSEWNAMLFNSPPTRTLPESEEIEKFIRNADGEGNSINEFMSHLDLMTSIFGVMWVSCVKFTEGEYALWKMHNPLDVINWEYKYDGSGNLKLNKLLIALSETEDVTIYRYMTPETISTVWVPKEKDEDEDQTPTFNIETDEEIREENGMFIVETENELGYIPCMPIYQSTKIYEGVGHTPIFDIAQIQKSVYGDFGELYSAITYGAHPVNIVDEQTSELNDGKIGAEPGTVLRVPGAIGGQQNYVYEFKAPPMQGVQEISTLIDQKIEKMNSVAMIRSDELIRASRSGAQIEQYDSKLEAFVRKKAVSLENAEYNMWIMWFDWINATMPEDLSISYNRQYGKRAVQHEIEEMTRLLTLYDDYKSRFMGEAQYMVEEYETQEQAEARAQELGGSGFHTHMREDGVTIYMPFATHQEYENAMEADLGIDVEEITEDFERIEDTLKKRIQQLLNGSYSENSL